jgi:hypothetical protein
MPGGVDAPKLPEIIFLSLRSLRVLRATHLFCDDEDEND